MDSSPTTPFSPLPPALPEPTSGFQHWLQRGTDISGHYVRKMNTSGNLDSYSIGTAVKYAFMQLVLKVVDVAANAFRTLITLPRAIFVTGWEGIKYFTPWKNPQAGTRIVQTWTDFTRALTMTIIKTIAAIAFPLGLAYKDLEYNYLGGAPNTGASGDTPEVEEQEDTRSPSTQSSHEPDTTTLSRVQQENLRFFNPETHSRLQMDPAGSVFAYLASQTGARPPPLSLDRPLSLINSIDEKDLSELPTPRIYEINDDAPLSPPLSTRTTGITRTIFDALHTAGFGTHDP